MIYKPQIFISKSDIIESFIAVELTVVFVYKDTLYKHNISKIWPKPTFFILACPSIKTICLFLMQVVS